MSLTVILPRVDEGGKRVVAHFYAESNDSQQLTHAEAARLVAPLRCRSSASGFRNVYLSDTGGEGVQIYKARVKRGGALLNLPGSASPTAIRCAVHVARWYQGEFGPQWASVLAARKINPFEIRESKLFGGFIAVAYVLGERTPIERLVRLPRRFGKDRWQTLPGQYEVFQSREAAKEGMRRYLRRLFGVFSGVVLWRPAPAASQQTRASAA
jgi:hypothetical protein